MKMTKLQECIEKLTNVSNATYLTGRIWQMDEDGNAMCTYKTIKEASVCTGVDGSNITTAIAKDYKAGGYYWRRNKDLVM